ncbi:rhodanese-like domain-containing protein [Azospirillum thermophilum]|nr:rhodanese-like domain-containing protein [Azospirillum thermophilum]
MSVSAALLACAALSACQTTGASRADVAKVAVADSNYANEKTDWGISPRNDLLIGGYHARTPATVPGARTIATADLQTLIAADPSVVLVDVLDGKAHPSLPQAVWMPDAGLDKSFQDATQKKLGERLAGLTGGDPKRPVVFYCLSAECWLSYNASLRAARLGYQSVYWYRGGLEAWKAAGLPTAAIERL